MRASPRIWEVCGTFLKFGVKLPLVESYVQTNRNASPNLRETVMLSKEPSYNFVDIFEGVAMEQSENSFHHCNLYTHRRGDFLRKGPFVTVWHWKIKFQMLWDRAKIDSTYSSTYPKDNKNIIGPPPRSLMNQHGLFEFSGMSHSDAG